MGEDQQHGWIFIIKRISIGGSSFAASVGGVVVVVISLVKKEITINPYRNVLPNPVPRPHFVLIIGHLESTSWTTSGAGYVNVCVVRGKL